MLVCTAGVWAVTAATIVLLAKASRPPVTRTLIIPFGTADRLGGGLAVGIPPTMDLVAGDVLTVRNEDRTMHQLGATLIPAGATSRVTFPRASVASFVCDFHPSGHFTLQVQPRGLDLRLTILPTALLGPATGLALVGVWAVVRRIVAD